jgi:hypothetical protein
VSSRLLPLAYYRPLRRAQIRHRDRPPPLKVKELANTRCAHSACRKDTLKVPQHEKTGWEWNKQAILPRNLLWSTSATLVPRLDTGAFHSRDACTPATTIRSFPTRGSPAPTNLNSAVCYPCCGASKTTAWHVRVCGPELLGTRDVATAQDTTWNRIREGLSNR